ncbi:5-formyltetrahydrofolate cyclo-ligase [Mycobacterium sp. PS03-16]|nr:5-formyltetrahydrofolate cyclo-ligase [Mycobacterium sp. PS03-16]TFV61195.1 5-formyltetrahydrofolate cyclo-ligase [Mycobacterium sp. PS03-16]
MKYATKDELRRELLRARSNMTPDQHEAEATALRRHLPAVVEAGQTICAYVPVAAEPGDLDFVDDLRQLGATVLLPVTRLDEAGAAMALQWGQYRPGGLVRARYGLWEPVAPWRSAAAVAEAAAVLVPALAVDRTGVRLGRGAGYYDRSLDSADPSARLIAVVRDEELVDRLPAEPHDVRMTHALTPGRGLVTLAATARSGE